MGIKKLTFINEPSEKHMRKGITIYKTENNQYALLCLDLAC